jgi:hypothetical protein
MELLGDVGHLESRFGPFTGSVSDGARQVHGLRQSIISSEIVLVHPMALLGWEAQVESHFSPFGDSANLDAR